MRTSTLSPRILLVLAASLGGFRTAHAQCQAWNSTFSPPSSGSIEALSVFNAGSGDALYAGGYFTSMGGTLASGVAKWDGHAWSALGAGTNNDATAFATFDDGTGPALFVGGSFTIAGGAPASSIAKWNGTSWSALGSGMDSTVYALTVFDDGTGAALYAGGAFSTAGGNPASSVARWNGSTWSALGTGITFTAGGGAVYALAVFDDGSGPALYAGGYFSDAGSAPASFVAKWNGSAWSPLGAGVNSTVSALAVFDDGSGSALYAAGAFSLAGGVPASHIAKWDGASWTALGSGTDAYVGHLAVFDDGTGTALYASGDTFSTAGGVNAARIAKWNGTTWSALGAGLPGYGNAMAVFDAGTGAMLHAATVGQTTNVGTLTAWNGTEWERLGGAGLAGPVYALSAFQGQGPARFYVGGDFSSPAYGDYPNFAGWNGSSWEALYAWYGASVRALLSLDTGAGEVLYIGADPGTGGATTIGSWNGLTTGVLGSGTNGPVLALAGFDDGLGTQLYAAGNFTSSGTITTNYVARWDGSSWHPVGGGTNAYVSALCLHDDGSGVGPLLYAAGNFTVAGGVTAYRIARWDGASWSPLGNGLNSYVYALASFDSGSGPRLYAGGNFTASGGVAAQHIAMWDGSAWHGVGGGVNGQVRALTSFDDGSGPSLVVGGSFTNAGGVWANSIAKWNGSTWATLGQGVNGEVFSLGSYHDASNIGPDLYLGGTFTQADGHASAGLAMWSGCAETGTPFCFGDGTGGPCPCGNNGSIGHGCENSSLSGGSQLSASGSPTSDAVVLRASGENPNASSIFLQGTLAIAGVPFGDGIRCVGGGLKRLYLKSAVGGVVTAPGPADLSIRARSAALGAPIPLGATRYYQTYYRDAQLGFCSPPIGNGWNVSNGISIRW